MFDHNNFFSLHGNGYSEHCRGFTGAFSFWRNHLAPWGSAWSVIAHDKSGFCVSGQAVTDDFGNLVQI